MKIKLSLAPLLVFFAMNSFGQKSSLPTTSSPSDLGSLFKPEPHAVALKAYTDAQAEAQALRESGAKRLTDAANAWASDPSDHHKAAFYETKILVMTDTFNMLEKRHSCSKALSATMAPLMEDLEKQVKRSKSSLASAVTQGKDLSGENAKLQASLDAAMQLMDAHKQASADTPPPPELLELVAKLRGGKSQLETNSRFLAWQEKDIQRKQSAMDRTGGKIQTLKSESILAETSMKTILAGITAEKARVTSLLEEIKSNELDKAIPTGASDSVEVESTLLTDLPLGGSSPSSEPAAPAADPGKGWAAIRAQVTSSPTPVKP